VQFPPTCRHNFREKKVLSTVTGYSKYTRTLPFQKTFFAPIFLHRQAATLKARLEPSSPTNSPEAEAQRDKEDSQGSSSTSKGKDKDKDTRFWGQRKFVGGGARPRVVFYMK
jgi:hypothetical protein